jgi:multidrug efflux pump subunit AcrA (membrane-fusion protein)
MVHWGRSEARVTHGFATVKTIQGVEALVALALLSSFASCSRGIAGRQADSSTAAKPIPVRIVRSELKQVRRDVESVGSLYPNEEVTVSSEVEGKVEQVMVDVGDRVSVGQPLVKISPAELQLSLDQQRAALRQARARLGLPDDGDDLTDVRAAAEVKRAAADLADAEQKYQRAKTLYEQGLVPRQSFDEAEARYKASRAAYDLAVQVVENLRAQLAQSRASAALAQKKLADSIIRAPFAGHVKERTVTQGQYLRVQTPVMVIVNTDPLRVRLKVPEKMAAWVRTGQVVTVRVEAYPDRSFSGKISRINPTVDQQTRSFEVEALIDNHDAALKPGFFVKATIPSDQVVDAVFVPQEALVYVYGVYKVLVVDGNTVRETEVKVGDRSGDDVEIVEGLSEGHQVALPPKGQELKDGAQIEVVRD